MNNNWTWTYLNNCARDASAPTIPNRHHADLQGNHTASSWVFIKNFQLTSWCCYRSISRSNGLQNGSDIRCETANTTQWIQWKSVLQNTKHFYSRRGKDQLQRWLQHSREAYGLYRVDSVDRLQTDSMKTQKLMNHVRLPHFLEYQSKEFPRRRRENRGFSSFLSICCFMVSQWSFYRRKDGSLCTRSVPVWRRRKDGVRTRFLCFSGSIDCHLQCIRRQAEIDPYKWRAASWALADLLRDLNEISLSISSKGTRFALFVYAMLHRRVSQCIYLVLYLCCRKNNMDSFFSIGFICVFVVCVSKSEQWNTISNWHHDSPLNHKLRPYALLLIQKRFWF